MRGWIGRSLVIFGIVALVWLGVVYSWRTSNRMPSTSELVLYLIVLPVGILTTIWIAIKAWGIATSPSTRSTDAAKTPQLDAGQNQASANRVEQEAALSVAILATAIRTPRGNSAEELAASLLSGKTTFDLDPELTDSNGYPILSARVHELNPQQTSDAFDQWVLKTGQKQLDWAEEHLRAIAAATEVIQQLAQTLVSHTLLPSYTTSTEDKRGDIALPVVRLIPLLPDSWKPEQRGRIADWLTYLLEEQGWPARKILLKPEATATPTAAMASIDRLMLETSRQRFPCVGIIIACESHLGETTISNWEAQGQLVDTQGNRIRIPGEGAAGLLLADPQQAHQLAGEVNVKLHRVVQASRNKSADEAGFAGEDLLGEMIQSALAANGMSADMVTHVCADTDHRSSRLMELIATGNRVFPNLDPNTQYLKTAAACGDMGAAAVIAALALAHQEVLKGLGPVICVSNHGTHERAVATVSSWRDTTPDLSEQNTTNA